ncbi:MAG: hypothetical protein HC903_08835 [Methylacidiphilales bacterium]|nr:hypothetical protein [Candidatus Methylacidiphilales bacterium]
MLIKTFVSKRDNSVPRVLSGVIWLWDGVAKARIIPRLINKANDVWSLLYFDAIALF